MTTAIGIVITDHIVAGRLEDQRLTAKPLRFPADPDEPDALAALPPSELVEILAGQIAFLAKADPRPLDAIGVAVPGIIRDGVVEDSPNLTQIKGMRLAARPRRKNSPPAASPRPSTSPTTPTPSPPASPPPTAGSKSSPASGPSATASATAAGLMSRASGRADTSPSPSTPKSATAAAAASVTLKASWAIAPCACASSTSSRKKSLPTPKHGDQRCREFVDLWHRALAAATASFIHLAGPGRFYFTGHNVGLLELPILRAHIESMVKMTPLQSFSLEILPPDDETALLGAGVSALRALAHVRSCQHPRLQFRGRVHAIRYRRLFRLLSTRGQY